MPPVPPAPQVAWLPFDARLALGAIALRLVSAFIALLAEVAIPNHLDQHFTVLERPHVFWDTFARYDSGWYFGIASKGYTYVEGGRSNLAFFPLYPTLMGLGGRLLGGRQADFYFAGIVVTWVSFVLASVCLYRLARLDLPHPQAVRTVLYAALMPGAYFFGVVYSEALFFLCLVGAVLAIRTQRWVWSALAGMALTASRVNGVLFVPALVWLAWQSATPGRDRRWGIASAAASVGGMLGYCAYNYALSGDPLAWYSSIERWGYSPGGNPVTAIAAIGYALVMRPFQFLAEPMAPYDTLNALSATLALVLVPLVWRRLGVAYAAIILLGLVLPLSSGQYEGLARYSAVLFPVPLYLASVGGEVRHLVLMTATAMLYTLGLVLFTNVYPL